MELDFFSLRIIGSSVSDRLKKYLALLAMERAIAIPRPPQAVIHRSDRRSQYCSDKHQNLLKKHNFTISMSGKGNCNDNAMVPTVFRTFKSELAWCAIYQICRLSALDDKSLTQF